MTATIKHFFTLLFLLWLGSCDESGEGGGAGASAGGAGGNASAGGQMIGGSGGVAASPDDAGAGRGGAAGPLGTAGAGGAAGAPTKSVPPPQDPNPGRGLFPHFWGGLRLEPRSFQHGEKDRLFVNFHDKEIGQTCVFAMASDGKQRCLPRASHLFATGLFSDDKCQLELLRPPIELMCSTGSGVYTTIEVPAPGQCPAVRNEVRKLTPAAAGVTTYVRIADGSCVATTQTSRANWMVPGQVIGPELFVAGELTILSRPGWSVGVQRVVAVDGAYLNLSAADIERKAPCRGGQVSLRGDGDRCIPTVHAGDAAPQAARYYADATCAKPLALHDGCDKPTMGVHRDLESELSVHRLGAVHDGVVYRTDDQNKHACGKAVRINARDLKGTLYQLEDEIPRDSFPRLGAILSNGVVYHSATKIAPPGELTLDERALLLVPMTLYRGSVYYHDGLCYPLRVRGVGVVCVPSTFVAQDGRQGYFAAEACTEPLVLSNAYEGNGNVIEVFQDGCGAEPVAGRLLVPGAPHSGVHYRNKLAGVEATCEGPFQTGAFAYIDGRYLRAFLGEASWAENTYPLIERVGERVVDP